MLVNNGPQGIYLAIKCSLFVYNFGILFNACFSSVLCFSDHHRSLNMPIFVCLLSNTHILSACLFICQVTFLVACLSSCLSACTPACMPALCSVCVQMQEKYEGYLKSLPADDQLRLNAKEYKPMSAQRLYVNKKSLAALQKKPSVSYKLLLSIGIVYLVNN